MVDVLALVLFIFAGSISGWFSVNLIPESLLSDILLQEGILEQVSKVSDLKLLLTGLGALIGLLSGLFLTQLRRSLVKRIKTVPTDLLIGRAVGLILGLLLANLLLAPILLLPLPGKIISIKALIAVLSNIFFGVLGYNLAEVHSRTLLRLFNPNSAEALLITEGILTPASAKIIDTSVIIDGRLKGLLDSEVLEGQVIIAQSVLDELQKLADSSNSEKRKKGRRGIKLLSDLRESYRKRIVINSTNYEGNGTDEMLIKLTSDTSGTLITTDFNLSEIARLKDLKVVNLSTLAIALKSDVQPGENLILKIVREGKENNQGIGYLDDGTMVVIEDAKASIGKKRQVIITGALQTPTGRMIFGRLEKDQPPHKSDKTNATYG